MIKIPLVVHEARGVERTAASNIYIYIIQYKLHDVQIAQCLPLCKFVEALFSHGLAVQVEEKLSANVLTIREDGQPHEQLLQIGIVLLLQPTLDPSRDIGDVSHIKCDLHGQQWRLDLRANTWIHRLKFWLQLLVLLTLVERLAVTLVAGGLERGWDALQPIKGDITG